MLSPLGRQHPKGLVILFFELLLGPVRMLQRGGPDGTGPKLKAVVLLDTLGGSSKGMLASKIRQHPLQPPTPATRGYSQPLGQWA